MSGPKNATPGQALAGLGVLAVVVCTPVASWFLMPHTPWWGFASSLILVSAIVFLMGTAALARILVIPDRPAADTPEVRPPFNPAAEPGPDDPVYAISVNDIRGRTCESRDRHDEHTYFWRAVNAPESGSTWCDGWPR